MSRHAWLLAVCISGCATAPLATPPSAPSAATPRKAERDVLELALVASGYESPAARRDARAKIEAMLEPIVGELEGVEDEASRAAQLLAALHERVLMRYDARATSLRELLERGEYNCLTAAILFNLVAERLGLAVEGELLPTHARAIVLLGARRVVVEATSPRGFDPDPATLESILDEVATSADAGQRAIVAASGASVEGWVLAGTIFVNRASLAQEDGDLEAAERLFERGERLVGVDGARRVLRDQRAVLLSQLGAADVLSEDVARGERALRSLLAAMSLDPAEPTIRATVEQNLRAAAEHRVRALMAVGDEAGIQDVLARVAPVARSAPSTHAAITAFAWSEIGRLRAQRSDLEGTLAAIDRGLEADLAVRDRPLARVLHQNRFATLRLWALSEARRGELQKSLELVQRLSNLPGLTTEQRSEAALDKSKVMQIAAQRRFAEGDRRGGVELYRRASRAAPSDDAARRNLAHGLQELCADAINAGRCADVEAELEELRRLAVNDGFVEQAQGRCEMLAAGERLAAGDVEGAVARLRRAYALWPEEPTVRKNLGIGLGALAREKVSAGQCDAARPLLEEALGLGADVAPLLERCPSSRESAPHGL